MRTHHAGSDQNQQRGFCCVVGGAGCSQWTQQGFQPNCWLTCLFCLLAERWEVSGNTTKNVCVLRAAGLLFWKEASRYVDPYVDLTPKPGRCSLGCGCAVSGVAVCEWELEVP